ncbi:aminopeptidase N [uncultured Thalassolituus sp.]|uniref:aminopeptidase N n=1 Tax=uncultured Thalassolituus sp. TaxID=285273 RepID=UPI002605F0C7|nr:aminopeptidase N [uncultured Thalassolituus sp.]
MRDAQPTAIQLTDYKEPAYEVVETHLRFELEEEFTLVTSTLKIRQLGESNELFLNGQELGLESISIDGRVLGEGEYTLGDESLMLTGLSAEHTLQVVTRIYPAKNTALEGLYRSGGMYCTQCEAEGFRRITYYPDRPDVMSVFTTEIIADAGQYPVLLSNGNPVSEEVIGGKRHVVWHDPHKKPAYLFALVAGDLLVTEDSFTTCGGREVALKIFVEPRNIDKTAYAMDALKRSMRWDEDVYGREYDLDIFMIVAVDDFNMGAMENKGLNIFNSSCVLANPATATDAAYQRIEAIVAHEYFHNWSGNRVTCRDWFQLSLKEGFTVFRDACFSADMNSATVKRVEDAGILRTVQFAEDAGPMAHPVQPDSYIEISNFYTVTIYEKGAEVVGMYHKILGAEGFRKGTDLYFDRHDGQAVTINEFVQAMEDANGVDFTQFRRWYKQAGTPVVDVLTSYDSGAGRLTLTLRQHTPDTPGQTDKQPLWIPVQLGLIGKDGSPLTVTPDQEEFWTESSQVLHFREAEQTFTFSGLEQEPAVSLFRDFSAPVRVNYQQSRETLRFLLRHDSDGFNRWDAGQRLMLTWIDDAREGRFELSDDDINVYRELLNDTDLDPAMVAYLLALPSESYIAEFSGEIDPLAIHSAREEVSGALASALRDDIVACYQRLNIAREYEPDPAHMAQRSLKNLALSYWSRTGDDGLAAAQQQYQKADNMTDQMAALRALVNSGDRMRAQSALDDFYERWQSDPLVVNQWLSVQAGSAEMATIEHINDLLAHPAFDWRNPNKVRSVIGAFANQALSRFHSADGEGYRLLADAVIRLNESNPQIASRLLAPLTRWKRLVPSQSQLMKAELQRIMQQGNLSKDVFEVVSKSLA